MLISPQGRKYEFSLPIVATSMNNQAEYQALLKGLEPIVLDDQKEWILLADYS